ncbi:hypothetical protein BCR43DRAFT_566761 [Syncephalastrum racemosum]|uniref:Uncharacterized protein n=1 Tax=Syncephalastrum racemosum TaxID=13706 RepID=A0A1X2H1G8_SYNRA|nr:hypothetical protein BCR43DRAFT_566761 [Syncephalastrum racemosum]
MSPGGGHGFEQSFGWSKHDDEHAQLKESYTLESVETATDKRDFKRFSIRNETAVKREGSKGFLASIAFPVINVVLTIAVLCGTIAIYKVADLKTIDYTMAGMRIPTLLALMMTIVKMFVSGGIQQAVSESKWVRLQRPGATLATLDLYDSCTRGVGGVLRVLPALRLDMTLIPAIIFQIGLIAMGPASQEILNAVSQVNCTNGGGGIWYTNITSWDMTTMLSGGGSGPMGFTGLDQDYVVHYAMEQAALNSFVLPQYECPQGAINCTYSNIAGFHTVANCQPGTLQTQMVDLKKNIVTTVGIYYGYSRNDSIFSPFVDVPEVHYAGAMHGRTYFDLRNYTAPFGSASKYNASLQQYFGDQSFVMVTAGNNMSSFLSSDSQPHVLECKLQSYKNISTFIYHNETWSSQHGPSTPITMDYKHLSNNTFWELNNGGDHTMMNAYGLQTTILRYLIVEYYIFKNVARNWSMFVSNANSSSIASFFEHILYNVDLSAVIALPVNPVIGVNGVSCLSVPAHYELNPAAYYILVLSLLVPLCWWAFVWIRSMYQNNGVSRGNSQAALLVAGATPALTEQLKGLSHSSSREIFKSTQHVKTVFGEMQTDQRQYTPGHITFGVPGELRPIRARRQSI